MGVRFNSQSGIDPKMIDQLIELEKLPIKRIEQRKEGLQTEEKEFRELSKLVSSLGTSLNAFRNKTDFYKMKFESSHPDIIDGTAGTGALPGSYEMEVRGLARTEKLLAEAFPDKDQTPVGFGFMVIELDDGRTFDIDIDPDKATLQDVANQINEANAGCKAVVLNTKESLEDGSKENFRLLVISEKSGKQGKIYIDPDLTYLEFKEQVTGRNLELQFEDVPVFNESNNVAELIPGMTFTAKRAEPGTKVTVSVNYDVDKTMESIQSFVDSYNQLNGFIEKQFKIDPKTNKAGILAKDNSIRSLGRSLKSALQFSKDTGGKFSTLSQIGISSDPKSGDLKLDAAKVKQSLSEDYEGVASLFVQSEQGEGFGFRMSEAVRGAQNTQTGVLSSKDREYKRLFRQMDDDIAKNERIASQKAESIKRRFASLEQFVSGMNAQGQAMQARLAGG
jgi:flagellar hook-associated protein 2